VELKDKIMRRKPKKKKRGKKKYKNTHGTWYRVRLGYKLRAKIKQKKILRQLNQTKKIKLLKNCDLLKCQ
jgi:hypothetical protein